MKAYLKKHIKNDKIRQFLKKNIVYFYNLTHSLSFIWALITTNRKNLSINFVLGGIRFNGCYLHCIGKGNKLNIGENCILKGVSFFFEGDNNEIIIGDGTHINASRKSPVCLNAVDGKKIIIGSNCLFSNNIQLHTSDYHRIMIENTMTGINRPKEIVIGDHCWIGLNCLILKGTTLPPNTIVGAGSIVTGTLNTSNCIIAGNPAKILKDKVDWDI